MGMTIGYIANYFAEAFITYTYANLIFTRKKKQIWTIVSFIIIYGVLYSCFSVNSLFLNAGTYLFGIYFLLLFNFDCKSKTAFFHSLFLSSMLLLTELLSSLLVSIVTKDFGAYQNSFPILIITVVISKLLYIMVAAISIRCSPRKDMRENAKMTVLFFILPVVSLLIALVSVRIGLNHGLAPGTEGIVILSFASLLVVNLLFMMLYYRMKAVSEEKLLLELTLEKEKASAAYYQALHEEEESRNILLHDIKKHLGSIRSLAKKEGNQGRHFVRKLSPFGFCSQPE